MAARVRALGLAGPTRARARGARRLTAIVPAALVALIVPAALVALLLGLLTACSAPSPYEGSWVLPRGHDADGELTLDESHPITLTISGRTVSGTAACNTYTGYLEPREDGPLPRSYAVTEMACSPTVLMDLERRYLDALVHVDEENLNGRALVLTGAGVELRFTPL